MTSGGTWHYFFSASLPQGRRIPSLAALNIERLKFHLELKLPFMNSAVCWAFREIRTGWFRHSPQPRDPTISSSLGQMSDATPIYWNILWQLFGRKKQKQNKKQPFWFLIGGNTERGLPDQEGRRKKCMLAWFSQEIVGMRKGLRDGPVQSESKEGGNVARVRGYNYWRTSNGY